MFARRSNLLQVVHESSLTSKKSAALLAAIKEYDANKWKVIGQKVGKPAKVGLDITPNARV